MLNPLRSRLWVIILTCNLLLTSCYPGQYLPSRFSAFQWAYADLRLLDAADEIPPTQDLVAFYARASGDVVTLRLDFLDLEALPDCDIYLALDTIPGGSVSLPIGVETTSPWDYWLVIPAAGPVLAYQSDGQPVVGLKLRIFRDPALDLVTVSFRASAMNINPGTAQVEVFTTPVLSNQPVDHIGPVRLDNPPPQPVSVFIAFWNVFPANTPAEALRSWDGAHAGPESSRHGLKYLLEAVKATGIPVALLDLKSPFSLSVLDYMGLFPKVEELDRSGLVFLPEVVPAPPLGVPPSRNGEWVAIQDASLGRKVSESFGLRLGSWTYRLGVDEFGDWVWPGCLVVGDVFGGGCFGLGVNDYAKYISPNEWPVQATRTGLALPFRRFLLSEAISLYPQVVLMGGDLSRSAWGNQFDAGMSLDYLAAHPWIYPLDELSLRATGNMLRAHSSFETPLDFVPGTPAGVPVLSALSTVQIHDRLLQSFLRTPPGRAYDLAWQAYSLTTASTPDQQHLKAIYLGQIGHLLAAADWESNPRSINDCQRDLDWDGQPECILASGEVFATFENEGGLMTTAFIRMLDGIHQVIAPSYQFTIGLSDPMLWQLERGVAADPGSLAGALQGSLDPWSSYVSYFIQDGIEFMSGDMSMRKSVTVLPTGFRFNFATASPWSLSIPLVLDPWIRFTKGWGDRIWIQPTPLGLKLGIKETIQVELTSNQPSTVSSFMTSRPFLSLPEDPNQDYTSGHYLPFPMSVLQVSGSGPGTILLTASQLP